MGRRKKILKGERAHINMKIHPKTAFENYKFPQDINNPQRKTILLDEWGYKRVKKWKIMEISIQVANFFLVFKFYLQNDDFVILFLEAFFFLFGLHDEYPYHLRINFVLSSHLFRLMETYYNIKKDRKWLQL